MFALVNDDLAGRRRTQAELYGAPLADCIHRLTQTFRLSQAALARILGVSAPMLSQLVSAQRIKIGNPVAAQRLQSLLELATEVDAGLEQREVERRLAEIERDDSTAMTRTRPRRDPGEVTTDLPEAFGRLLRAIASGRELHGAAELLTTDYPDLAEVLRIYGTGSPRQRARHYEGLAGLL